VTDGDRPAFAQCINRLAKALRTPLDAADFEVYFLALSDLSLFAVERGALELQRTQVSKTGQSFFPTTAQWHLAATTAHEALIRNALPPAREEPWHIECPERNQVHPEGCGDTGWRERICRPGARCGCRLYANHATAEHPYTVPCPCRATNRTYRARHHLPPVSAESR